METREKYEEDKMEITRKVSEIMEEAVKTTFSQLDEGTLNFIRKLYDARRKRAEKGGRLRDITVLTSLNLCGIKEITKDHLKVIAAGEFYNIASYYQNWHLDNKKEVESERDAKLCHIASHIFRELTHRLIYDTGFSEKIKLRLLREISESNLSIQIGQALELNVLANLNSSLHRERKEIEIVDQYLRRCYLFSGYFYGCSFSMGPIMAGADEATILTFKEIGESFGTGGQIINDAGDFCLNKSVANNVDKDYKDQFRDMEKGTLTLPVLELSKIIDISPYLGKKLSNIQKEFLLAKMVENRCFDSARKQSNFFRNKIKKLIYTLPEMPARSRLAFMSRVFFNSNKFYVNLREEHGYVWGK